MKHVRVFIQERPVAHFYRADPEYGSRVAAGLNLDIEEAMAKAA
jgi:catalase